MATRCGADPLPADATYPSCGLSLGAEPVTLAVRSRRIWPAVYGLMLPDGRARVRRSILRAGSADACGVEEMFRPRGFGGRAQCGRVRGDDRRHPPGDDRGSVPRGGDLRAVIAIALILFGLLRRVLDASLVMAPLLMSALLTLLVAVVLPLPLNFANIIALPLLLGVGVSFNIYFVMNWRAGQHRPLGSATARAILFSALTTGTCVWITGVVGSPRHVEHGEAFAYQSGVHVAGELKNIPPCWLHDALVENMEAMIAWRATPRCC